MTEVKVGLLFFFLFAMVGTIKAQLTDVEVGGFLGGAVYQGDLSDQLFDPAGAVFGYTGRYKYYYTLNFRANLLLSRLKGSDKGASRNFSFTTTMIELSGMAELEPLGRWRELGNGTKKLKFSPYLLGGLGFLLAHPKATFGTVTNPALQDQINQDSQKGKTKLLLVIPIGAGVRYDLNREWMIGAEAAVRYPFTDYLDGISRAANPKAGDWYWFYGVTAMYLIQ